MASDRHIIRKASLEVQAGSVDAFRFQSEAVAWVQNRLLPELEEIFGSLPETEAHVILDRLEIQVDTVDAADWGTDILPKLKAELTAALIRKIRAADGGDGEERLSAQSSWLRNLAFYLEHGVLPWNMAAATAADLEARLEKWAASEEARKLAPNLAVLWQLPSARMRFLAAFSAPLVLRILIRLFRMSETLAAAWSRDAAYIASPPAGRTLRAPKPATPALSLPPSLFQEILAALCHTPRLFELGLEEEIIHAYLGRTLLEQSIQPRDWKVIPFESAAFNFSLDRILRQASATRPRGPEATDLEPQGNSSPSPTPENQTPAPSAPEDKDQGEPPEDPAKEGIYIADAGLILLAPFLSMLFERLELASQGELKDPATAISLMHYLVTGQEGPAEFQVALPKVLCGWPLEKAISLPMTLAESMKTEADQLLESVIGHWGILKSTSVEGLRESFLQRQGKLSRSIKGDGKGDWLLQVEQKAYDMLLQQLPWSFQMIRLSWMKNVLRTEWIE